MPVVLALGLYHIIFVVKRELKLNQRLNVKQIKISFYLNDSF